MAKPTANKINIEIPEQGISLSVSREEAQRFLDEEDAFYATCAPLYSQQQLQMGNNNLGSNENTLAREIKRTIEATRSAINERNDFEPLASKARSFGYLVGSGSIGKRVSQLIAGGRKLQAIWTLVLFGAGREQDAWVEPFRAAALSHPGVASYADTVSSAHANELSKETHREMSQAISDLNAFIEEKTKLIDQLADLYRNKLVIEAPAKTWETIADSKRKAWTFWLMLFSVLAVAPLLIAIIFWPALSAAVADINKGSTSGFSLTGLALITVPALFYAWLLKNVSRGFIQNMNLADDAEHRRAMATAYLGLAENKNVDIKEAERAIILNALFRPVPPHGGDDGPPAGLIDLIKSR